MLISGQPGVRARTSCRRSAKRAPGGDHGGNTPKDSVKMYKPWQFQWIYVYSIPIYTCIYVYILIFIFCLFVYLATFLGSDVDCQRGIIKTKTQTSTGNDYKKNKQKQRKKKDNILLYSKNSNKGCFQRRDSCKVLHDDNPQSMYELFEAFCTCYNMRTYGCIICVPV